MRNLAHVRISDGDFDSLRHLCAADPRFPASRPAWDALVAESEDHMLLAGRAPAPLMISAPVFHDWCRHVGIVPSLQALAAWVLVTRETRETRETRSDAS